MQDHQSMAGYVTLLALFIAILISPLTATYDAPSRNQDLIVAIGEMQKATYFTFIMLINMAPVNLTWANVTFLMPNDRTLSKIIIPENSVTDFLRRHSIPSPLLFDYLQHIPSGSTIPTSKPDFMLEISNNGRKSFNLNNVRIISPNICTAGSSIRCHGIDGVVQATTVPSPTCSVSSSTIPEVAALPPTITSGFNLTAQAPAPSPADKNGIMQKSSSSQLLLGGGLLKLVAVWFICSQYL